MIIRASVLVDLGNSETRVILQHGGNVERFTLSNRFSPVGSKSISGEYNNAESTVFSVDNLVYGNGMLIAREYKGREDRPSAIGRKTSQLITELTMNLVLIRCSLLLATKLGVDVNTLQLTYDIGVLLPPLEHEVLECRGKMVDKVKVIKKLSAIIPQKIDLAVSFGTVDVYAEGVSAFFGAFFELNNGTLGVNANNAKFAEGYTLILDIGAGTSDLALLENTEIINDSKETLNKGGNTVEAKLEKSLKMDYGYTPENLTAVVESGKLRDSSIEHDVTTLVNQAKDDVAQQLNLDIKRYLEKQAINMRNIRGLLVCGGGSLSSVDTLGKVLITSLADRILIKLKEFAPNIELFDLSNKDVRWLNLEGVMLLQWYAKSQAEDALKG